jgi:endonuclease/exonuclease/phosphatase (EEP) superfamily protein YafD
MVTRVLAAAAIVVVAAALLVAAWPQLFALEKAPVIAQVVSMRGLAIAIAIFGVIALTLVALISVATRRFAASIAIALLAFVAVSTAVLSTRGFGDSAFQTANESDVTVLTWNTLGDSPDPQIIAQLGIDSGAEIISLPETTQAMGNEIAAAMAAAGVVMHVKTVAYDEVSKARSTTLLISAELGEYTVDATERTTTVLPSVVATPDDGTGPVIIAVHPVAPIPGEMAHWREDLKWIANACTGENIIMAGDFNSTIDHYVGLANSPDTVLGDCLDAALASDNGAVGTWPTMIPALLGSPIDRVLYTDNWKVTGMRVNEAFDKLGSDHRPVIVQLSPAG